MRFYYPKKLFIFITMILVSAVVCNRNVIKPDQSTPEGQLAEAKRIFEKKNYDKAKMQFTIVVLNNPGSRIVEEAQFFLAESHYHLKEYILAVAEYEKLIRSMPQSQYLDDARYKIGMCYYKLAPHYGLDQEYTYKAIMQFEQFLDEYPTSDLKEEVEKMLGECQDKLARKEYKTGELYYKMSYFTAAIISFNRVLNEFSNSNYIEASLYYKGLSELKMKKFDEAELSFQTLINNFKEGDYFTKGRSKLEETRKEREKYLQQQKSEQE